MTRLARRNKSRRINRLKRFGKWPLTLPLWKRIELNVTGPVRLSWNGYRIG